jgi:hypothetical protein
MVRITRQRCPDLGTVSRSFISANRDYQMSRHDNAGCTVAPEGKGAEGRCPVARPIAGAELCQGRPECPLQISFPSRGLSLSVVELFAGIGAFEEGYFRSGHPTLPLEVVSRDFISFDSILSLDDFASFRVDILLLEAV